MSLLSTGSPSMSLRINIVIGSSVVPTRVACEVISNGSSEMNTM